MGNRWPASLLAVLFASVVFGTQAAELTGRVSATGFVAGAGQGDIERDKASGTTIADQESLRLMLDHAQADSEWSVHLKVRRFHSHGHSHGSGGGHPFRYRSLGSDWTDGQDNDRTHMARYEIDRAVYRLHRENLSLGMGRQAIDWGSGRLWQPLNVFGAFAPTDLDTEYKPGIDALTVDWYPSPFSSLSGAVVLPRHDGETNKGSVALRYKSLVGEQSEATLLAGQVLGSNVVGGAFESVLGGAGWRFEAAHYHLAHTKKDAWFAIAGMDYRFEDGTVLVAEWHRNTHGPSSQGELALLADDPLVPIGLRQQLSRDVYGVLVEREITPLLTGSYLFLASPLKDEASDTTFSFAHHFSLVYSLSDESDVLLSVFLANGAGINDMDEVRSEFGHLPDSITLQARFYF